MRRAVIAMAVALVVASCAGDAYPLPSGPGSSLAHPATVGQASRAVLIFLEVRPGDRIELIEANAVGTLDGATVAFLLSRPVLEANGDRVIGREFEALEGAVVTAATASPDPGNTVGIAAQLTAQQPGRFEITNVRLRYRLNGGLERVKEGTDVVWTVCADDPAPANCPERPEET
jgi:hypothetical protein